MKIDTTLLEKDTPPTIAELRAFFREHDFSNQVSRYNPWAASKEQNAVYIRAKKHFISAWNKQMGTLIGKRSLINYSSNSPVRTLEEANENLIAGTVMEILSDASLCERKPAGYPVSVSACTHRRDTAQHHAGCKPIYN